MSSQEKSVLLVEDDVHTQRRLAASIDNHPRLSVTACDSLCCAREAMARSWPDVLVTDLGLPDGSGIDLIREARAGNDTTEIMVISVFGDERNVLSAIEAGAGGYLLKDGDTPYIGKAIMKLIEGESPISAAIARHILKRQQHLTPPCKPTSSAEELTAREQEVLNCMAKGYSYREAAQILGMSYHTITSHVKKIYRKLEVNSRSEAIYEAAQLGLVNLRS